MKVYQIFEIRANQGGGPEFYSIDNIYNSKLKALIAAKVRYAKHCSHFSTKFYTVTGLKEELYTDTNAIYYGNRKEFPVFIVPGGTKNEELDFGYLIEEVEVL